MDAPDLFEVFVQPLHRAGLPYMISGSVASVHYGEPRLTLDVDIVVHLDEAETARLLNLFPGEDFYTPPRETVEMEIARPSRGHFNILHLPSGLKADFYPSKQHAYWGWAWEHRKLSAIGEEEAYFAPPEYVILWKLEFFRAEEGKHLRDVRGMLLVNRESIDREMLARACRELGLEEVWQTAVDNA